MVKNSRNGRGRRSESPTLRKYRELLGVSETAVLEDLKKAYHARAFLYHPDRNQDPAAPEQFQQIREAFERLSDPAYVQSLKQNYLKERLFDFCIDGLQLSFGTFFGYRVFVADTEGAIPRARRLGKENAEQTPVSTGAETVYIEEDRSILDNAAYDSIEVVYAGKFSTEDEARLTSGGRHTTESQLPWVVLNNKGIIEFIDGNFERSLKCYEELNRRMANNIIFMYREALCHIVLAFKNPQTTFWGSSVPNKKGISTGVQQLKKCIRIGESRTVGKQKCVVIRKVLADVLERIGQGRASRRLWKEIGTLQPQSVEAKMKSGYAKEAKALAKAKKTSQISTSSLNKTLLIGRSRNKMSS